LSGADCQKRMPLLAYILALAVALAATTTSFRVAKGETAADELPEFFKGATGHLRAYFVTFFAFFSAISMVVWGFLHLKWHLTLLGVPCGFLLSAATQTFVRPRHLLVALPPMLVLLQLELWVRLGR